MGSKGPRPLEHGLVLIRDAERGLTLLTPGGGPDTGQQEGVCGLFLDTGVSDLQLLRTARDTCTHMHIHPCGHTHTHTYAHAQSPRAPQPPAWPSPLLAAPRLPGLPLHTSPLIPFSGVTNDMMATCVPKARLHLGGGGEKGGSKGRRARGLLLRVRPRRAPVPTPGPRWA